MAGTFTIGETKTRPGIYHRYENAGGVSTGTTGRKGEGLSPAVTTTGRKRAFTVRRNSWSISKRTRSWATSCA